jgi:hypothetical protein
MVYLQIVEKHYLLVSIRLYEYLTSYTRDDKFNKNEINRYL